MNKIDNIPVEAYPLGQPLKEFRAPKSQLLVALILIPLLLGMGCISLPGLANVGSTPVPLVLLVLVPVFIYMLVRGAFIEWQSGQHRLVVFSDGLLYVYKRKTDVFKWDDITTIWRNQFDYYSRYGFKTRTTWVYNLLHKDGAEIVLLSKYFPKFEDLAQILDTEVTNRLIAKLMGIYASGESIEFGDLVINKDGIDNDGETLKWQDANINFHNGRMYIAKRGEAQFWFDSDLYDIPNAPVLAHLVSVVQRNLQTAHQISGIDVY